MVSRNREMYCLAIHEETLPQLLYNFLTEAEFLGVIGTNVLWVFLLHSHIYQRILPLPPLEQKWLIPFCYVNIVYANIKYENSQDYARNLNEIERSWIRLHFSESFDSTRTYQWILYSQETAPLKAMGGEGSLTYSWTYLSLIDSEPFSLYMMLLNSDCMVENLTLIDT